MNEPVAWRNHLPALALILLMVGVIALGWPWPDPVANGFDAQDRAVHWMWPPATIGAAVLLWLVFFALDGVWGLVEGGRKRFNPFSLLDEGLIAWMLVRVADAGVPGGVSPTLRASTWAAGGLALAAAAALEARRRSAAPSPSGTTAEDVTAFGSELSALSAPGQRWSYWSVQRPPHPLLFGSLGLFLVIGGVAIPGSPVLMRLLLVVAGLLVLALCSGGFRTVVTAHRLVLRAGHFSPPLLRLATTEIAEVTVPELDPMPHFGVWGIRLFGDLAGVWAFNLSRSGVLVRTISGRRYLIGTDQPERLAAALNAARGAA